MLSVGHLKESDLVLSRERRRYYQIEGAAVQVGLKEFRTEFKKAANQSNCRGKLHTQCIHILSTYYLINLQQVTVIILRSPASFTLPRPMIEIQFFITKLSRMSKLISLPLRYFLHLNFCLFYSVPHFPKSLVAPSYLIC